jgi:hypothetical protein
MLDPWISNFTLKVMVMLSLIVPIYIALRLGLRHRRVQAEQAERDNRTRDLFHQGVPDRDGDRTAELLNELQSSFGQADPEEQKNLGATNLRN